MIREVEAEIQQQSSGERNEREQMLRDIRQLLKEAPRGKRLAFVERYLGEQEELLQAQPRAVADGRLDYTNLYGKQLAQLEQWLFTEGGVESVRWDVDGNLAKVVYRTPQPPSATIEAVLDILPDLLAGWWTGETDDGFQHETFEPYNDASRFTGILRAYVQYRKVRQALPQPAPPVATKAIPTINDATLQGKAEEKAIEEGT